MENAKLKITIFDLPELLDWESTGLFVIYMNVYYVVFRIFILLCRSYYNGRKKWNFFHEYKGWGKFWNGILIVRVLITYMFFVIYIVTQI